MLNIFIKQIALYNVCVFIYEKGEKEWDREKNASIYWYKYKKKFKYSLTFRKYKVIITTNDLFYVNINILQKLEI